MSANLAEDLHDPAQNAVEAVYSCIRDGNLSRLQELLASSPYPDLGHVHLQHGPPLHFAAGCGDLEAEKLLLAAGADPLLIDRRTRRIRPIGWAAMNGHRDVVRHLWTCGPPEEQTKPLDHVKSPLRAAGEYGHAQIVEDLMSWDGWPKDHLEQVLSYATADWDYNVVARLFKSDLLDRKSATQALFGAINSNKAWLRGVSEGFDYINQQRLIELFISAGADLNHSISGSGYPLVCKAASNANLTGALTILLEKGAEPNVRLPHSGATALHILALPVPVGGQDSGRKVLNEVAVKLLLQHRASVTLLDNNGDSSIQLAAYGSDLRFFCLYLCPFPNRLRDESTLMALTNEHKETLLHYAAAGCCVEIMEYLISRGLDINAKSTQGWTPLMCALTPSSMPPYNRGAVTVTTASQATQAAQCLLSYGADPLVVTAEGWTPLHALALHCDLDLRLHVGKVCELTAQLIARGVNPEARAPLLTYLRTSDDQLGMPWGHRVSDTMMNASPRSWIIQPSLTPLHWAAQRGATGVVRALVAAGADISLTDGSGVSALEMARDSKALAVRTEAADVIVGLLWRDI
ncbi:ankyrin repeat protein [Emericellopsis atlantica]|uniref:Ankyrin repeat protein n=1 Tax=Emericellopsis atlantica TaxID=2614577 RepID=A0A9P7ZFR7_9HYPO|nr:ankyrin repeat protein [Emericellopsis atlantica]KAG9250847.1 ankyrin repeat protein [Emericellopsis atlantica]